MQFHLIAFVPVIVLLGTGLLASGVSLMIRFMSSKANLREMLADPAAIPAAEKRSAEILYFPAPKARPKLAVMGRNLSASALAKY